MQNLKNDVEIVLVEKQHLFIIIIVIISILIFLLNYYYFYFFYYYIFYCISNKLLSKVKILKNDHYSKKLSSHFFITRIINNAFYFYT